MNVKEVAKLAGVSVATVSRVINSDPKVSEKTRKKVFDVINSTGYQPNSLARDLRKLNTKRILVVLPTISNQFYSSIINGINDMAIKNGYLVLMCMTNQDVNSERNYIQMLKNRAVDGCIFLLTTMSREEVKELDRTYPLVFCCEGVKGAEVSLASIDNEKAAYDAVTYLIGKGHRRIAYFGYGDRFISSEKRLRGYKQALENAGIGYDESIVYTGDFSFDTGIDGVKKVFKSAGELPTALFCTADSVAVGAVKTLFEINLKVPQDVEVIGFDNTPSSEFYTPAISTVAQPQYELGQAAMSLLLDRISEPEKSHKQVELSHELLIRY